MNEIIIQNASAGLLPVEPRVSIEIRPATVADIPFMDSLQKKTTKQVGFMPTKQFEGKVAAGQVLIAEAKAGVGSEQWIVGSKGEDRSSLPTNHYQLPTPIGYLIGQDQYFKRDDVGVIYQINVMPEYRRHLVAASLLKAQFERSAYGCKLYCCWCAQDIEANRFWESMGFVPIAFRTGSRTKGKKGEARVHIFWQKRIREGDERTAWWFPSKTAGGALNEDRIVLPIPHGVNWRDEMPRVLPEGEVDSHREDAKDAKGAKQIEEVKHGRAARGTRKAGDRKLEIEDGKSSKRVVQFGPPRVEKVEAVKEEVAVKEKIEKPKRVKAKADPKMVAAARELRDRWLDAVNSGQASVALPAGKYEVSRQIAVGEAVDGQRGRLLEAA